MTTPHVFDAIQPILVDAIPKAMRLLQHDGPLCVVRIYYYDTHAPCTYLDFRCVTLAARQRLLDEKGRDALFYIWASGEECGVRPPIDIPNEPPSTDVDKRISALFASIYDLLCENEDENMQAFRAALQSVCKRLNAVDWNSCCAVSDDFVVVPADGSQHFADYYSDLVNSIPAERLQLLRTRGLLGPDGNWARRPGFDYGDDPDMARMVAEIEQRASSMPETARIAYWIDQLDNMAAGRQCDMTRIEVNANFPLRHIGEIGTQVVVPLLRLACKWADKPEWDVDDEDKAEKTPMSEVMLYLLWKIQELAVDCDQEVSQYCGLA